MNPAGRMLLFPPSWSLLCRGVAILALAALPAEAQPGANWSASGLVSMQYRTELGGTVFGRNAETIHETLETDIIAGIDIGSPFGGDTPGTLSISDLGDSEAPRDLGDVEVDVGTLSLTSSFVDGRIRLTRPEASMTMLLTEMAATSDIVVLDGATLTAQASTIYPNAREGSTVRISSCIGIVDTTIGADVEIDLSDLRRARFYGKQVITNTTITGVNDTNGEVRQGEFDFENVSLDVANSFGVGGGNSLDPPTDTDFILTSSTIESGTGTVRAGVGITTGFEMRGSVWRSFGAFAIRNSGTQVEIESGSRIDARADFRIGGAIATIGSTTGTSSRIDVAGNFDLKGTLPGTLTIEDGGVVDVDGTLTIGELGTLNLNGGTLRVGNLVFEDDGVLNENGGTLIVPEAAGIAPSLAAVLALALLRRRRD